jgi:hypothetical protein
MKTGIAKQIIGSFEDIGKDVAREVVKAPVDIAGAMLEGLGTTKSSSGKGQTQTPSKILNPEKDSSLGKLEKTDDTEVKKQIARAALEQISQKPDRAPTVWERLNREEEEKKKREKERSELEGKQLQKMSQKKKRGNLYGVKQKQSPTEKMVNVKTD